MSAVTLVTRQPLPGGRGLFEARFHGRGGQGTVVASILLSEAAFLEGRGVQASPFFGVERRGAPVTAHARIGERALHLASDITTPDVVIVMDPTLLASTRDALAAPLREGGLVLASTTRAPAELGFTRRGLRVATVDGAAIARRHGLGSAANPIVNTAVLGALVRATGVVTLAALEQAIREKVPAMREENVRAARDGHAEAVLS